MLEFTKEDLEYYREKRLETDYIRFMKIWKIITEEAKKINPKGKDGITLKLSIAKISKKSRIGQGVVRKRLKEMKDFGAIDYSMLGGGTTTTIYFNFNEKSAYLDEQLEIDKKSKYLSNFLRT